MNTPLRPSPDPFGPPASAARADLLIGLVDDWGAGYVRFNQQACLEQVNELFVQWSGISRETLLGKHVSELLAGDLIPPQAKAAWLLDPSALAHPFELRTAQGILPIRVSARPIFNEAGEADGGYWLLQDLRTEADSRRERLESLRLRALGALTAGIAHDFNNILTTVLGQTEMMELRHGSELSADARQRLSRIERSGRQAAALVSQMLTFARLRAEERAQIDLGSVISSAIEVLRHGLPEDIHLRKDLRTPQRMVWGSLTQLQIAIIRMSLTVQKEMQEGGILVLRLEHVPEDGTHPQWLQITIADASTDDLPEPVPMAQENESAEPELAEILGSHGGFWQRTHPRRFVSLLPPFVAGDAGKERFLSLSSLDRLKGCGRILLVEDDAAVAETTAQMLRSLGYEVVTAVLPSVALQIMQHEFRQFDLMVTDITMPEMNGYQLADEISRQFGPLPVLFVTGYDFNVSAGSAARILLQKPLTLQRLGEGVQRAMSTTNT
jgi:CheY-like chemotaxis protein/signal transduction histidine kinase